MIKIIFLVTQAEWGGAQKYVFDLATNLPKDQYDILVAAGTGHDDELFARLKNHGIKVRKLMHTVRAIRPLKEIFAVIELIKLFKKELPDIIHLNSSKVGILGGLAAKMASADADHPPFVIYTAHGWVFNEPLPQFVKWLYLMLEKWTAKYKNIIITPSEFDRQIAINKNIAESSKVIAVNNGIGQINFLDKQAARQKLQQILSTRGWSAFGRNPQIIGAIANLYKTKGLEYLIKAAAMITKEQPDLIFTVIGKGPEHKKLASLIKIHNLTKNFFLLGSVTQASRYLKAFDIFVLPSVKEGWPYTVLEALQAGLPIIATTVGGLPEIISPGHNGLLVNPAKPAELAQAIKMILNDPHYASSFKDNAVETAERFNIGDTLTKTYKIYQKAPRHF